MGVDFCRDGQDCTHPTILRGLQQVALACERCDGSHFLCTEHLATDREIGAQDAEDAQREVGT